MFGNILKQVKIKKKKIIDSIKNFNKNKDNKNEEKVEEEEGEK